MSSYLFKNIIKNVFTNYTYLIHTVYHKSEFAQSPGAVEYTDCTSAEW